MKQAIRIRCKRHGEQRAGWVPREGIMVCEKCWNEGKVYTSSWSLKNHYAQEDDLPFDPPERENVRRFE